MEITVIIDNGHGEETPGKCSPDRRLKEWKYTREIAQRVSRELTLAGINTLLLVPENTDTPLNNRTRKVNAWARKLGPKNVVLVSIHINAAASDNKWHNASGFSVFISPNASLNSKQLAKIFTDNASRLGLKGNRSVPPQKFWVQSLAMTRDSICPAVLTENLFQDNQDDVNYLLSEEGRRMIVKLHVDSIIQYIQWINAAKK